VRRSCALSPWLHLGLLRLRGRPSIASACRRGRPRAIFSGKGMGGGIMGRRRLETRRGGGVGGVIGREGGGVDDFFIF
jgi:hypothetical protein